MIQEAVKSIGLNNGILGALVVILAGVVGYLYLNGRKESAEHKGDMAALNKEFRDQTSGIVQALTLSTTALQANERVFAQITNSMTSTAQGLTTLVSSIDERSERTHDDVQRIERGQEALARGFESVRDAVRRAPQ